MDISGIIGFLRGGGPRGGGLKNPIMVCRLNLYNQWIYQWIHRFHDFAPCHMQNTCRTICLQTATVLNAGAKVLLGLWPIPGGAFCPCCPLRHISTFASFPEKKRICVQGLVQATLMHLAKDEQVAKPSSMTHI